MADIKLSTFKSQVQDLCRPNRFWVQITGGTAASEWQEQNHAYLVKTTSMPGRTIGNIELNWQGMKAKISGDPTFDDITMTFLNDYSWNAKNFIEKWMEEVATMASNVRTAHGTYKAQIKMEQLGRDGETIATYTLEGAYPITMDAIELSQESSDTVEEISVTFTYDYFTKS